MSVRIFLSCVSDEFRDYRDQLRSRLTRHNVDVKVQEDFKDSGGVTLETLDLYIASCDAVVHLVGEMTGSPAKPASMRAILARHPDLGEKLPPLRGPLGEGLAVSYTQWEAWLALYHGKELLIARAATTAPRGPRFAPSEESRAAQKDHLARLEEVDRYPGSRVFTSADDLAAHILGTSVLELLVQQALAERAQVDAAAPSAGTAPLAPPRCLGRQEEIRHLVAALLDDNGPVAALVLGGAGMGKTTLTLEAAGDPEVSARFGQRRWFVPLETASDADALERAVVAALGMDPAAVRFESALERLAGAPALVILDNLETPWEHDAAAVEAQLARLAAAPNVALLASVRSGAAPRGVRWTAQIEVHPLAQADARALFLDIAGVAAEDPGLEPLLEALGGVPLAVELAAERAGEIGDLGELWREWERIGTGLAERRGMARSRLSSIERSLALSVQSPRLGEAGLRLFRLLGQLPAGISREDREAIMGPASFDAASGLLATRLAVRRAPDRLDLLPPVRDVARRSYAPADADAETWRQHYVGLARDRGRRIWSADGAGAVDRLAPETANLEAAIRASATGGALAEALSAAGGYRRLIGTTGIGSPAVVGELAAACGRAGDLAGEAGCIWALGDIALRRSDHEGARARYEAALPLYRRLGDAKGEANCISGLGDIAYRRSDLDEARSRYEAALPLYRQAGEVVGEANCIWGLGDVATARSDHEQARARFEAALPLYRQVGDILGEANCIWRLGDIALARSDHEAALARYEAALPLYRRVGVVEGEANCIWQLGEIALERADYESARSRFEAALLLYRQFGSILGEANCIKSLGDIALERADHEAALARYDAALPLYRQFGSILGEANCIKRAADIALARADHAAALARYETALPLYRQSGTIRGEANCIQGLGDIALARGDPEGARGAFLDALALYDRIADPYDIGWAHHRLARLSSGTARADHIAAARAAWTSIARPDLVATLDGLVDAARPDQEGSRLQGKEAAMNGRLQSGT